ncbi:hypothetical protein HID58_007356, partial [Brassica napus]
SLVRTLVESSLPGTGFEISIFFELHTQIYSLSTIYTPPQTIAHSPAQVTSYSPNPTLSLRTSTPQTVTDRSRLSTPPADENRYYQTSATQRKVSGNYPREKSTDLPKQPPNTFHERVDRHGRSFGERVSTKQTRNPPPEKTTVGLETSNQTWKSKPVQERSQSYASPPYSRNRENSSRQGSRGKDLFPQRSLGQWRPRLALARGAIMEELQEVTRQYLSCPDPVEAAARRQRVLYGDANGMLEETVERLLASGQGVPTEQRRQRAADSNPVTPPPLNENPFQAPLFPDPSTPYTPPTREEDWGQDPRYSDVLQVATQETTDLEGNQQTRIRSIIVSPAAGSTESQTEQTKQKDSDGEETLKEFQNKVRRKSTRTAKRKQIRASPNILRGASSKKRKLSQVQNSPKGVTAEKRKSKGGARTERTTDKTGPSDASRNPPIQLIPAMARKKPDFRSLPHQAP